MNGAYQKKADSNNHGHVMTGKSKPEMDDEGDMTSYAACINCGAHENEDEIIRDCPNKV